MKSLNGTADQRVAYQLAAYKDANSRPIGIRFARSLYNTPIGLLMIEWERQQWTPTWLPKPVNLK